MTNFKQRAEEAAKKYASKYWDEKIDLQWIASVADFIKGVEWAAKTGDPDRYDVAWSDGVYEGKKEALKNLPRCKTCEHYRMGDCNNIDCPPFEDGCGTRFGCILHSELSK